MFLTKSVTLHTKVNSGIPHQFTIRVYGLLVDQGMLLLTDEFRLGIFMTKFPGGGLQFGEGPVDCVKREFLEELNLEIEIIRHFYTTEYYQPTTLLPSSMQLISIYYLVRAVTAYHFPVTEKRFDFQNVTDGAQCFRWVPIGELTGEEVTFPIDKTVVHLLKSEFHV